VIFAFSALADLHCPVCHRMTKYGMETQVGRSIFLEDQPGGGAPASPKFWDPYIRTHNMRNNDQILHDDQTRKTCTWSTANADTQSVCGS